MSRVAGYPADNGRRLTDGAGKTIGTCRVLNKSKVEGWQRGGWISGERVSYRCKIDGKLYGCRGRGDGISASCRILKRQRD